MREIPIEELEAPFRLTLEKAQKAIAGKYFHYARALLLGLLEHYPNAPTLRLMTRQVTLLIHEPPLSHFLAWTRTMFIHCFYVFRNSPLREINSLEKVLVHTPDFLWAHKTIAKIAISKELWATAALSLETITTLDPKASHEKILLAKIYLKLGKTEEAQNIVKTIVNTAGRNEFEQELQKATDEKK